MRRAYATLVIVALLAAPLALLARGEGVDSGECDRMCCLRHSHHSGAMSHAKDGTAAEGTMCHRSAGVQKCECAMRSGQNSIDHGFLAPIAPTAPSAIARILNPEVSREYFARFIEFAISGFLSAPFEPPRS